jgi:hypothetical protein
MHRNICLALTYLLLIQPAFGWTVGPRTTTEITYATSTKWKTYGSRSKSKGTAGTGCSMRRPFGLVGCWDLGDTRGLIKGGYTFAPASDHHFRRTSSVPFTAAGFWGVGWFVSTSLAAGETLFQLDDASDLNTFSVTTTITTGTVSATTTATTPASATTTGGITANRWQCVIFYFASATDRGVYLDTDTTGATNATSRTPSGIANVTLGRNSAGTLEFAGDMGTWWLFSGTVADSNQRAEIFAGGDPETVMNASATALWTLDNDAGADSRGSYGLTANGSPTARNNLYVVRDCSGGKRHMRATIAAPTWSSSQANAQGGGVFASASNQFLTWGTNAAVTAAPLQVYLVGQSNNITATQTAFWVGDKDAAADMWELVFAGAVANDPTQWTAIDTTANSAVVNSYAADTNYLLWGTDTANNARATERNNSTAGTEATNRTPDNADSMAIGMRRDSTPDQPVDGETDIVLLLNQTEANSLSQAAIETFTNQVYSLGF